MKPLFTKIFALSALLILNATLLPSTAAAQKVVCANPATNTLITKKLKKCQKLGFPIVSADQVGTTVKVYDESFPKSLSSIGDISGSAVFCPEGTLATGGGASIVSNDGLMLKTTIPRTELDGWAATVQAIESNATGTLNIYVICATNISATPDEEEEE